MTSSDASLGARIQQARKAKKWTQAELARALTEQGIETGSSITNLSLIESGRRAPSADLLAALSVVLGLSLPPRQIPPRDKRDASSLGRPLTDDALYLPTVADLLVRCHTATIIARPGQAITSLIEEAIRRRRSTMHKYEFWRMLRVIVPHNDLLPFVHDDLSGDHPSAEGAREARERRVASDRRAIMSLLLRENARSRWHVQSYPFVPAPVGALLGMPDGSQKVVLPLDRAARGSEDSRCVILDDGPDAYFQTAFHEVSAAANEEHEEVLVGDLSGDRFFYRRTRWRRAVMNSGENITDWIPAVLGLTYRTTGDGVHPLLQINTPKTSTRELTKVSHMSGYVTAEDMFSSGPTSVPAGSTLEVTQSVAMRAVEREMKTDFRIELESCSMVKQIPFHYPDKESLFFYVFVAQVPADAVLPASSLLVPWTFDELMQVREHQVYRRIIEVATNVNLTQKQQVLASLGLQLNLQVHGQRELAEQVQAALRPAASQTALRQLSTSARLVADETQVERRIGTKSYIVSGLAGLQYRAFFDCLVPAYAELGVFGADAWIEDLEGDRVRQQACAQLSLFYADPEAQAALGIEV